MVIRQLGLYFIFIFGICIYGVNTAYAQNEDAPSAEDLKEFGVPQKKPPPSDEIEENIEEDQEIVVPKQPTQDVNVQWYLPEIGETDKLKRTRVIIPGKTTPGARVFVNSKAIIVITKDNRVGYLPTRKAMAKNPIAVADEDGLFSLELDLPNYTVQLPLGVVPPGSRKVARRFQLNLSVEKEKVRYTNLKIVSKSPAYTKRYGLWFGAGGNYLYFQQSSPTINQNINFKTLKLPSAFAKAWMWLNETWDISATAKMSPGNTSSSQDIQVQQGSYQWWIFATEATYYPESMRYDIFTNYKAQLAWRFGLQHHIVPFVARTENFDVNNTTTVLTNDITMATAGFKFLIREHSRFTYEVFLRYQYPLMSGDTFEIQPKFAFDGSLGAIYEYTKNWRVGLFWYGQWHEYQFTHEDTYRKNKFPSLDPNITGDTRLFFSNIELRAGFEFN
ncbi:MAG: hypothetical protein KDD34_08265 [Bdellovibrionales bacterium]|nr:hypothetical protein [Bdellovibrionales bacterium]